ncbi:MAG: TMEM165/GDT1 family protein [Spirochaetia bacterium]|nr:TMEM165/GDT1 family protein [Spirochaetota bacterium]MCX8096311.1 TMEM165/GDT1 family protein [Spirochaetota bacterium]MDW8112328.1 TMEM165/GDT1 family protein [Spirochaetia bacterium]
MPILTSFLLITIVEISDKTMFLTLGMTPKFRKISLVVGVLLSSIIIMLIPTLVGEWLNRVVPRGSLVLTSGLVFLVVGLFVVFEKQKKTEKEYVKRIPEFLKVFLILFTSEMFDRSQLTALSITINSREPLMVWIGGTLGLLVPNLAVIFFTDKLANLIGNNLLKYVTGGILITVGILTILEYFGVIQF